MVVKRTLIAVYCVFIAVCMISVSAASKDAQATDPVSGWEDPVMLEFLNSDNFEPDPPQVSADPFGNAFVVWGQWDGDRYCVFADRYVYGRGWAGAELIDSTFTDDCLHPDVAVDGHGNAIAVWGQTTSFVSSVWANRYVVGEGWGTPEVIETQMEEAGTPEVVVEPSGNATVVWKQYLSGHGHLWSNRYVVGLGWGVEEEVEPYVESAFSFDIALDGAGCVVAVWSQDDVTYRNVSANRYVPGEGWGEAEMIGGNLPGEPAEPKVAVDSSGNATAVWYQFDGAYWSICYNRYEVGEGWGAAGLIEHDDSGDASAVRVADDGSGTALAVWQQGDAGVPSIWSSFYVPGEGWGTPGTVEDSSEFAYIPTAVMYGPDNRTVLWHHWDGERLAVCSSSYVAGEGWGEMETASADRGTNSGGVEASVDGFGDIFAVWLQGDGVRNNVWANRHVLLDVTPPPLSIESPEDGLVTETPTVTVSGLTEPGATLAVNGVYAVVDDSGDFSCVIALLDGENTITATATDASGNSAEASVDVTYVNPVPALEQQLADALADLATAEDALADAQDLLAEAMDSMASLEEDLDAAEADAALLWTQLNATLATLTSAQEVLADALDELSEAEDALTDAQEELEGTEDDLDAARSQNLLLMAALAAVAVVAIVMAVMYLRTRGKPGGSGGGAKDA
jgi:hypothetical protein